MCDVVSTSKEIHTRTGECTKHFIICTLLPYKHVHLFFVHYTPSILKYLHYEELSCTYLVKRLIIQCEKCSISNLLNIVPKTRSNPFIVQNNDNTMKYLLQNELKTVETGLFKPVAGFEFGNMESVYIRITLIMYVCPTHSDTINIIIYKRYLYVIRLNLIVYYLL